MELNAQQKEAVFAPNSESIKVTAGPGSGKTRVISERIGYLIGNGVDASKILGIAFTNKAAKEIKERVGEVGEASTLSNIHGYASLALSQFLTYGKLSSYTSHYTIVDGDTEKKLIKDLVKYVYPEYAKEHKDFALFIYRCKKEGISSTLNLKMDLIDGLCKEPDESKKNAMTDVFNKYNELLCKNDKMDFDDLLINFNYILENGLYNSEFEYVFVDEAQDLNASQANIVRQHLKEGVKLFIVGDENQSIYAWMGSSPKYMNELAEVAGCREIRLIKNYRSGGDIVNEANKVLQSNSSENNGTNATVEKLEFEDYKSEMASLCEDIIVNGEGKKIAILYRNSSILPQIKKCLKETDIDFSIPDENVEKYDLPNIKLSLSYIDLFLDSSNINLITVLEDGKAIGKESVEKLKGMMFSEPETNIYSIIKTNVKSLGLKDGVKAQFLTMKLDKMSKLLSSDATTVYDDVLWFLNSIKCVDDDVLTLIEPFKAIKGGNKKDAIRQFVIEIANDKKEMTTLDKTKDAPVTVMTMHQSKGLEFDRVYLVGVENGILPLDVNDPKEIEEGRKLLFVAMTRAKEYLRVSYCRSRMIYGQFVDGGKSMLLD